jgi:hypothetical protein
MQIRVQVKRKKKISKTTLTTFNENLETNFYTNWDASHTFMSNYLSFGRVFPFLALSKSSGPFPKPDDNRMRIRYSGLFNQQKANLLLFTSTKTFLAEKCTTQASQDI